MGDYDARALSSAQGDILYAQWARQQQPYQEWQRQQPFMQDAYNKTKDRIYNPQLYPTGSPVNVPGATQWNAGMQPGGRADLSGKVAFSEAMPQDVQNQVQGAYNTLGNMNLNNYYDTSKNALSGEMARRGITDSSGALSGRIGLENWRTRAGAEMGAQGVLAGIQAGQGARQDWNAAVGQQFGMQGNLYDEAQNRARYGWEQTQATDAANLQRWAASRAATLENQGLKDKQYWDAINYMTQQSGNQWTMADPTGAISGFGQAAARTGAQEDSEAQARAAMWGGLASGAGYLFGGPAGAAAGAWLGGRLGGGSGGGSQPGGSYPIGG